MRRGGFDAYVPVVAVDQVTGGLGRHEDLIGHGPTHKLYDDMGTVRGPDGNYLFGQRTADKNTCWHSPYEAVKTAAGPQNIFMLWVLMTIGVGPLAVAPFVAAYAERFGVETLSGIAHR